MAQQGAELAPGGKALCSRPGRPPLPSYAVELLQPGLRPTPTVLTLFAERLSPELQGWWYSRRPQQEQPLPDPPDTTKPAVEAAG